MSKIVHFKWIFRTENCCPFIQISLYFILKCLIIRNHYLDQWWRNSTTPYGINRPQVNINITVTSWWTRWPLKLLASRLFAQPFVPAQIKENIKAPHYWPLWGGIHRWPVDILNKRASNTENVSTWWRHHETSPHSAVSNLRIFWAENISITLVKIM